MNPSETPAPDTNSQNVSPPEAPIEPAAVPAQQLTPLPELPAKESQSLKVVTGGSGRRGGSAKTKVLSLLLILLLAGAGFAAYKMWQPAKTTNNSVSSAAKVTKQDIPQLTVGMVDATLNLYKPNDVNGYNQTVAYQIYEGLVTYQDRTKIVPALATGWQNPNDSTWDFDLRRNVTFHNGHVMTAADVVYSFKEAMKDGEDGVYSSTLKDVKAINDYKVELTTAKPDPFLLNKLTLLMVLDSKTPGATDGSNGTGPYQLKPGTKPEEKSLQLIAFDKFHAGHVHTRALTFKTESDINTLVTDYKAGKFNMIGEFKTENPAELAGTTYHNVKMLDPAVHFLTVNSVAAGPLQKKEVRQALRESLDLNALVKSANLAAEPASQLVAKEITGYNPALTVPKQNIADAKKLLTSAGYPNGVSLELETSTVPASLAAAKAITEQAKAAGITITLKQIDDFNQLIGDVLGGKTQVALLSYGSDNLDSSDVFANVVQQTENFKSKTLDDYMTQQAETFNESQRLQVLQKISKYLNDEVAAVPLYTQYRIWETDKPYVLPYDQLNSGLGISFWQAYLPK
jgi:peptide/nickel transport system substrate-binding protein